MILLCCQNIKVPFIVITMSLSCANIDLVYKETPKTNCHIFYHNINAILIKYMTICFWCFFVNLINICTSQTHGNDYDWYFNILTTQQDHCLYVIPAKTKKNKQKRALLLQTSSIAE